MNLINVMQKQWDRTAAVVLTLAGVIALFAGYIGVADSVVLAEQTRYIVSGGIAGLFMLGLGATLWISADLRDEWRKLDRIEQALGDGVLRWSDGTDSSAANVAQRSQSRAVNGSAATTQPALANAVSSREHA
ncbi:hypothetical protein GCM10009547_37020 [Sporichthya brevicatena]|uniref:Uncharacterized protein n=1 Tax=Sporichthya brevicatena TaxID=171442 RepID=A0ABN1H607_9ACTN